MGPFCANAKASLWCGVSRILSSVPGWTDSVRQIHGFAGAPCAIIGCCRKPKKKALMHYVILSCTLLLGMAVGQDANSTPPAPSQNSNATSQAGSTGQKTTPIPLSRAQRLGAAKTAFVKKVEGSEIPVSVITNSLEG